MIPSTLHVISRDATTPSRQMPMPISPTIHMHLPQIGPNINRHKWGRGTSRVPVAVIPIITSVIPNTIVIIDLRTKSPSRRMNTPNSLLSHIASYIPY